LLASYPDVSFSLHLKMLTALAFVPPCDVVATFDELDRSPFFQLHKDILDRYLEYFTNTWISTKIAIIAKVAVLAISIGKIAI
jgi:hypothetical protein